MIEMKTLFMIHIEKETHIYIYIEAITAFTPEVSAHMSATVSPCIKAKLAKAEELIVPYLLVSQNMHVPRSPIPMKKGKIPIIALTTTVPDYHIVF